MTTDINKLPSADKEVRADLWATMSVTQLLNQQEMVMDKITKLQSMTPVGGAGTAGITGLLKALQHAMENLTQLIETKSSQRQTGKPNG